MAAAILDSPTCRGEQLKRSWCKPCPFPPLDLAPWGHLRLPVSSSKRMFGGRERRVIHSERQTGPPVHHSFRHTEEKWWRRRESNPRPKILSKKNLRAYPLQFVSRSDTQKRQDCQTASPVRFASCPRTTTTSYPVCRRPTFTAQAPVKETAT